MQARHISSDIHRVTIDVWPDLGHMLGVGRNKAYELVNTGEVRTVRVGRRILVPKAAVDEYLSGVNRANE